MTHPIPSGHLTFFSRKLQIAFATLAITLLMGCGLGEKYQVQLHHLFPQEFRSVFSEAGIDIDDYCIPLDKQTHTGAGTGLHANWNKEWKTFLEANPTASRDDMLTHLKSMLQIEGFVGTIEFVRYQPGKKVHGKKTDERIVVKSDNKFLQFSSGLGEKIIGSAEDSPFGQAVGHPDITNNLGSNLRCFSRHILLLGWLMYLGVTPIFGTPLKPQGAVPTG